MTTESISPLKIKSEPTAKDLQDLRDFGIDLMQEGGYGVALLEAFYDMKKLKQLIEILFEGKIPEVIESKVKGPVIEEALRDFFAKFGLLFRY